MPEQATEPSVVEGGHLQQTLKGQRMTPVSFGSVIEAGLFIGEWQVRPQRRRVMGSLVPKRLASLSPDSPTPLGVWRA